MGNGNESPPSVSGMSRERALRRAPAAMQQIQCCTAKWRDEFHRRRPIYVAVQHGGFLRPVALGGRVVMYVNRIEAEQPELRASPSDGEAPTRVTPDMIDRYLAEARRLRSEAFLGWLTRVADAVKRAFRSPTAPTQEARS